MKIQLKRINIINFKGLRNFTATFDGDGELRGDNATGKTTLFDAFTWCLYGKDSYGRSDTNFQIKPLDESGNVIERLPHEVEIELIVDDSPLIIRKTYNEVWTKKRGSREETFTGHTTERYWNDVPVTEREFKSKIDTLCCESVFKLITNPTYFLSQSKKDQREVLIAMAGDVSRDDLPDFHELVVKMGSKTTEEYQKELAAKIKRIKADMEGIPQRIDERQRDMPAEADWAALSAELAAKQKELDDVQAQMESNTAAYNDYNKQRQDLFKELSDTKVKISQRRHELREQALSDYYKSMEAAAKYKRDVEAAQVIFNAKSQELERANITLGNYNTDREQLIAEWRKIKARKWEGVDESQFICPTCKQPLPQEEIDTKIAEMERNYNMETARLLEANKKDGIDNNVKKDECMKVIAALQKEVEDLKEQMEVLKNNPVEAITKPQVDTDFNDDEKIQDLLSLESGLKLSIDGMEIYKGADNVKLKDRRTALQKEITDIQMQLQDKQRIDANNKRIKELTEQYRSQQAEIATLEGELDQIDDMKHALIDLVEDKINSIFTMVKFRMYEKQINGGEKETCEALVDGVPYSTNLNTAARINAGIDVINAISKHNEVYAPIFIDNRESVTSLIDTDSQVINLIKDENYHLLTLIK